MKKILFFVVMGIAITQFANAQVVELIGQGVLGDNPSTLIIPDDGLIEKVVVVAAAVFYDSAVPNDVTFSDDDETYTVSFTETDPNLTPTYILNDPKLAFGYYTATFNTVDGLEEITLDNYGQEDYVVSFTAYVYRSGDAHGIFSDVQGPHAYMFRLGSEFPLEYSFTIPSSVSARDVVVTLPFSHLHSSNLRPANVMVTAGDKFIESEFETNNAGDLLRLETLTLEDVDGDVTEVKVTIYSQTIAETEDGEGGGSFITGPGLLATTFEEDGGCTLTQGYWKTHSEYGPAPYDATWAELANGADTEFFLSGKSYYEVFWTAPKGNPYYTLAHQYMAAELSIIAGASDAAVATEMAQAKDLFGTYTPAQVIAMGNKNPVKKLFKSLGEILDQYNNGEIGPGHCDDQEFDVKSAQINIGNDIRISEFAVYPNPIINNATVSFIPAFDGLATVDLYNSLGQKTSRLMHQSVAKDIPVSFNFSAKQFNEGLYILMIQNGPDRESVKIQISR